MTVATSRRVSKPPEAPKVVSRKGKEQRADDNVYKGGDVCEREA